MKRVLVLILLIIALLLTGSAWAGDTIATTAATNGFGSEYSVPQKQITVHEEQIISPAFGTAVGRVVVPDGWSVTVQDLSIGSESMTWPNAIFVTVSSPDGSCTLSYISVREFYQFCNNILGTMAYSEDDGFDYKKLAHTLNYRDASACCDLMCAVLYGADKNATVVKEYQFSAENEAAIEQFRQKYIESVVASDKNAKSAGLSVGELIGADFTAAKRKYQNADGEIIMLASSLGTTTQMQNMGLIYQTTVWKMPFVFGIRTNSVDEYEELFDIFCNVTSASKEYYAMCSATGSRLLAEYAEAMAGTGEITIGENGGYSDIEADTIESGNSYSAIEGWDDVIKEQNDYTTGTGDHVKVDIGFDHVFEFDDGSILATNTYPEGGTELFPTEVGG